MPRATIASFQNSKVKLANKLINKRQRESSGLFLVDDGRDLARALARGYEVEFAFFHPQRATDEDHALVAQIGEEQVYDVSAELLEKAGYRQNPGALVAVLRQKPSPSLAAVLQAQHGHILALVDLRKPGNIGALLRTADAAGFGIICLIDSTLDLYNPNIIRSSTGAVFLDNIVRMSSADAFHQFSEHEIAIVAAHLKGRQSLYDLDFNAQRWAIALGTEDRGLDDRWVSHSTALVKIPMMGQMSDSLNVSVSGAIFMYEALRQAMSKQQDKP